jgi:hypothetical protein
VPALFQSSLTRPGRRPDNDLVGQINRCVSDANVFYRISFDPAHAEHADEYHALKLLVGKPGLTVRKNTAITTSLSGKCVGAIR